MEEESGAYAKNYLRVSKDCLYMIIALWMENFVVGPRQDDNDPDHHKVGAVLVLPNDIVWAVDCSRNGVHAVARLLMKHHDKAEGSKMFMSRKPCPMCAKLLVQSKVERVLFLPFEPEHYGLDRPRSRASRTLQNYKDNQTRQVDSLFTASVIAETKFTLQVEKTVLEKLKEDVPQGLEQKVSQTKLNLVKKHGFEKDPGWITHVEEKLPWRAFDQMMKTQFIAYFDEVMEWIATVLVGRGNGSDYMFRLVNFNRRRTFNPATNDTHKKQAQHFIEIARFLAERKDDPKTGVGAVIVSKDMEILSFGWNGFPLKAYYGQFGRASRTDQSQDRKYPYVIHAEQNALLMRNKQDIKGAILFVTKAPCNECAPLLAAEEIATVVVDSDVERGDPPVLGELGNDKFFEMVMQRKFDCYQTQTIED